LGVVVILAGTLLAAGAFAVLPQTDWWSARAPRRDELLARGLASLLIFSTGLAIGTTMIVGGQLVLAFLDIRARVAQIDRRLRDLKESPERESPLAERLRPRS